MNEQFIKDINELLADNNITHSESNHWSDIRYRIREYVSAEVKKALDEDHFRSELEAKTIIASKGV